MKKTKQTFAIALAESGTAREKKFFADNKLVAALEDDDLAYKQLKIWNRHINKEPETGKQWLPNYHTAEPKYRLWHWVTADAKRPSGFSLSGTSANFCG